MKNTYKTLAAALIATACMPAFADVYTNDDGQRVECHNETVTTRTDHPVAAPIAGAAVGGLVGHNFGKGDGRKAATAAGAVGGAVVGNEYNKNQQANATDVQRVCKPIG